MTSVAVTRKGSVLGSVLLILGSAIGVGILPLPVLMAEGGVVPSVAVLAGCALYMSVTALLILETSLTLGGEQNVFSMARATLSRMGQAVALASFLFLFYALMTAYLAKGGEIAEGLVGLPQGMGGLVLAGVAMGVIGVGARGVDYLNRGFMGGLALTYGYLVVSGAGRFAGERLADANWNVALWTVPFAVTSFGYHNMVPSVCAYLGSGRRETVRAVVLSGVLLLAVYAVWVVGLQGAIPLEALRESLARGEIVTEPLARVVASPWVAGCAVYLAFCAIVTSILGQGLSVVDFLGDMVGGARGLRGRLALAAVFLGPAYGFSQAFPGVFFKALELAGGVAAMAVFGLVPALMSWVVRYRRPGLRAVVLVPGGRGMLVAVAAIALAVMGYEAGRHL